MKRKGKIMALVLTVTMSLGILAGCTKSESTTADDASKEVNVYSSRHYDVDKEIYKKFEDETGIKVNIVEGKSDELLERIKREGEDTKADVFLTVGGESISVANEADVLQPIKSKKTLENIPEEFRGSDNKWVGLTSRARAIVYSKDRVNPDSIKTYEDLTKDEFKDKVLVRSSSSSYNQALLASFIQENGVDWSTNWAEGVVNNMARTPEGNDRDQVKAIAAGTGDVAIVNSYYLGKLLNSSDQEEKKAGEAVKIKFPENTHLNISWGGITKNAKNQENAELFLEYLTDEEVQTMYSNENYEYPLNKNANTNELLKTWGEFNKQNINYDTLGDSLPEAVKVFDKVGWK